MDVLNDIFETLSLKGVLYFRTDFATPWGVTVPDLDQAARFHLVVQGGLHVAFPSGCSVQMGPGDLVLIPRGSSHILSDRPGRPAPPLEAVLSESGYDGEGVLVVGEGNPAASTQLICGHYSFRKDAEHPLLRALPEYLLTTRAMRERNPWLDDMLRLLSRRLFSSEIGSDAAVTRLSEIVLIELLRAGVEQNEALRDVIAAFRDRQIGRALELLHARPAEAWTVESLAAEVGMSRSRFADRFRELMGVGPMAYLSDWRFQKALALLDDNRISIQQVATRSGYQSPAAFTRAFSGKFGVAPKEYRIKSL